jgi:hypothetical protein
MLTQSDLDKFSGSDELHPHWLKTFTYTDGVKFLAERGNAYWLLDAIASHQPNLLRKNPMLQSFQIWKLTVADRKGILWCGSDSDKLQLVQKIPFTDFPLPEVKLYLVDKVLILPSEY